MDHEDLSVIGCACLVTTPIPEVLTYFRSPRRSQPVWELQLARELREELGVEVSVGDRLGVDVALTAGMTLRAYRATLTSGSPQPHDHRALRWVTVDELDALAWVPADRVWLPDLAEALSTSRREST